MAGRRPDLMDYILALFLVIAALGAPIGMLVWWFLIK